MFRQTASRLIATTTATGRLVVTLPLGIARSVLERVTHHGDSGSAAPTHDTAAPAQQAPQPSAAHQAAEAVGKSPKPASKRSTPAARKASTPKAGDITPEDDGPSVVLTVDSPPEQVEPPVDVVGEALAAESEEAEQQAKVPDQIDDEDRVVYSTTSDDRA